MVQIFALVTNDGKVGKIHFESRLHKFAWRARKSLRNAALRLRGVDPLLPKGVADADFARLRLLEGRYSLGRRAECRARADLVRDPVDRFISDYSFRVDRGCIGRPAKRKRHAFWTYDVDARFVDHVYANRAWNEINLQCRYLGGEDVFDRGQARRRDERVFLTEPSNRLNDFLLLLRPVLRPEFEASAPPRRRRSEPVGPRRHHPPETLEGPWSPEDQLLFNYVSRVFNDISSRGGESNSPFPRLAGRKRTNAQPARPSGA